MGVYASPRSNGLHITCGICKGAPMTAETGRTWDDEGEHGDWLWYRCTWNPNHITRALPLPVRMARSC